MATLVKKRYIFMLKGNPVSHESKPLGKEEATSEVSSGAVIL